MKRFRITEDNEVKSKHNTLQECVDWLNKQEIGLHSFYVEDLEDDIEVDADEVIQAFNEGERYMDLQGF